MAKNSEISHELILEYAKRYEENQTKKEKELESIIKLNINQKFLTKKVFNAILEWKSPRIGKRKEEDKKFIKNLTSISFSTQNKRLKIEILCLLKGVGYRVASAILRFAFPDKYTVMDFRAWGTLKHFGKIKGNIKDNYESWEEYLKICRRLAKEHNVSLIQLDRFLWRYSKENQISP